MPPETRANESSSSSHPPSSRHAKSRHNHSSNSSNTTSLTKTLINLYLPDFNPLDDPFMCEDFLDCVDDFMATFSTAEVDTLDPLIQNYEIEILKTYTFFSNTELVNNLLTFHNDTEDAKDELNFPVKLEKKSPISYSPGECFKLSTLQGYRLILHSPKSKEDSRYVEYISGFTSRLDFDFATVLSRIAVNSIEPNAPLKVLEKAAGLLVDDFLKLNKNPYVANAAKRRAKIRNSQWSDIGKESRRDRDRSEKRNGGGKERRPQRRKDSYEVIEKDDKQRVTPRSESKGRGYRGPRMGVSVFPELPVFQEEFSDTGSNAGSRPASRESSPYRNNNNKLTSKEKRAGIYKPRSESAPPVENHIPWPQERRPTAGPQHLLPVLMARTDNRGRRENLECVSQTLNERDEIPELDFGNQQEVGWGGRTTGQAMIQLQNVLEEVENLIGKLEADK
ncbi:hypothetical protein HK098_002773 [Nowakowskiella sp. JEL0407]|nr:hypothetical protein HK098_002773 [Nowakowskiella sp. JEL0407]